MPLATLEHIQSPSAIRHHHPSIRITQPQTGRRVLPPPEGPNLSKALCLVSSVLCYHLTCDSMTHHINCIAGNKHRQLARQVGVLSRSSQQVRWLRSTSARSPSSRAWSSPSGASTLSPASMEGCTSPIRRQPRSA